MSDFLRPLFDRFQGGAVNHRASSANSHKDPRTGVNFTGVFTGEFILNNPLGCYWNALVQAGALALTESAYSEVGGNDYVKITADGNAITVPGAWVQIGSTAIDTTAAAVNHIFVCKTVEGIVYSVHVE